MATRNGPIKGAAGWILHRLLASYWSLPLLAVGAMLPVSYGLLAIDRAGLSGALVARDLTLVPAAGAAQEFVSVVVGVNVALLTLYFSITLLVLTIATANLGVRLIDRWLDKRLTRVSLGGLTFNLGLSLVILAAIDPDADFATLPHATLWVVLAFELVNIVMLAVALHDLGRTMFVDRAIAALGRDARENAPRIVGRTPHVGSWAETLRSPVDGYVEGIDLGRLARELSGHGGTIRFCAAPGQHIMRGEPLALFEREGADRSRVLQAMPIGRFRSDGQGSVFEIRLLVEIAARALSPAVNDFYTALACADRLGDAMGGHADLWVDEGVAPAYAEDTRFELPGQDFRGLYDAPLAAFRQAAADYPSVSIRMIGNFARVHALLSEGGCPPGLSNYLRSLAADLRDHAVSRAGIESDREDISEAFARFDDRSG